MVPTYNIVPCIQTVFLRGNDGLYRIVYTTSQAIKLMARRNVTVTSAERLQDKLKKYEKFKVKCHIYEEFYTVMYFI